MAQETKTVFLISDIPPGKRSSGVVEKTCQGLGWQCRHVQTITGAGSILKHALQGIQRADLIIADLSSLDPFVLHYVGVAHTLSNRVLLLFAGARAQLPQYLHSYNVFSYEDSIDGADALGSKIAQAITTLDEWGSGPNNPVQDVQHKGPSARPVTDDAVQTLIVEQQRLGSAFEEKLDQLPQQIVAQMQAALHEALQPRAQIDTSLLDQQLRELRERYDEMFRLRNQAEGYLQDLIGQYDTLEAQLMGSVRAIERAGSSPTGTGHDGAELVLIPATLFVPGPRRAEGDDSAEVVYLVRSFFMDRYPVTNRQFERFARETGYQTLNELRNQEQGREGPTWRNPRGPNTGLRGIEDHPVVFVHHADALAYAEWAGRRLPTELEWERAARGSSSSEWPWGDTWDASAANIGGAGTTPVNRYQHGVSPAGCWDMVGNVWEWLASAKPGGDLLLVGGAWDEAAPKRPYERLRTRRDGAKASIGFRCAMDA